MNERPPVAVIVGVRAVLCVCLSVTLACCQYWNLGRCDGPDTRAIDRSTPFDGGALSAGLEFVQRALCPSAFWIRGLIAPKLVFAGEPHSARHPWEVEH